MGTKIYGIPYDSNSVLIVDTETDTADTTTISGITGSAKFAGGVLFHDRIFCAPHNGDSCCECCSCSMLSAAIVLLFSPPFFLNNAATADRLRGSQSSKLQSQTVCCSKLHHRNYILSAVAANYILIIDPILNVVDTTLITGLSNEPSKYMDAVFVGSRIFFLPFEANEVLIVETQRDFEGCSPITPANEAPPVGASLENNCRVHAMNSYLLTY